MAKILIVNVGNRTLIEVNHNNKAIGQEKFIAPDGSEIDGNFKKITKQILDNQWFDSVKINIIDRLLDKYINDINIVYLFVSNQEGNYTNQDTIYAGKILKTLIAKKYENIETDNIHIIEINSEIIRADELIPEYRKAILNIKKENPDLSFIFCDSGGTPQQKTSMKIVAEYLLKGKEYEYTQVVQKADYNETLNFENAEVKLLANIEYQKVVNDENIILICKNGAYQGAKLLRKEAYGEKDKVYKVLSFLDLRLNRLKARAKSYANELQNLQSFITVSNYLQGNPIGSYAGWENDLHKADFFDLCEILSVAQFYWQLGDLSTAVLNYQVFIESFCSSLIKKKTNIDMSIQYEIFKNYVNEPNRFESLERDSNLPTKWFVKRYNKQTQEEIPDLKISLPVNIELAKSLGSEKAKNLIHTFCKCIRFNRTRTQSGLNDLRNDIAHNGIGVLDVAQINNYVEGGNFEEIINLWNIAFGLPSINIYVQSNKEIEDFIRN